MKRRVPRTSPETVAVEAVWWDDVAYQIKGTLRDALRDAPMLSIGAVVFEDDDLLVLANGIDPERKHWLGDESDLSTHRIRKPYVTKRQVLETITVRLPEGEDSDREEDADTTSPA